MAFGRNRGRSNPERQPRQPQESTQVQDVPRLPEWNLPLDTPEEAKRNQRNHRRTVRKRRIAFGTGVAVTAAAGVALFSNPSWGHIGDKPKDPLAQSDCETILQQFDLDYQKQETAERNGDPALGHYIDVVQTDIDVIKNAKVSKITGEQYCLPAMSVNFSVRKLAQPALTYSFDASSTYEEGGRPIAMHWKLQDPNQPDDVGNNNVMQRALNQKTPNAEVFDYQYSAKPLSNTIVLRACDVFDQCVERSMTLPTR